MNRHIAYPSGEVFADRTTRRCVKESVDETSSERNYLPSGLLTARPEPSEGAPQHLCLDKAYDAEKLKACAMKLPQDTEAVVAAMVRPCSQGQTEGSV